MFVRRFEEVRAGSSYRILHGGATHSARYLTAADADRAAVERADLEAGVTTEVQARHILVDAEQTVRAEDAGEQLELATLKSMV